MENGVAIPTTTWSESRLSCDSKRHCPGRTEEAPGLTAPVNIRDVAAMAGVSVGTVSNVLNHAHLVREEKREQVEAAIERLNFVRSEPARQLRAGRSRMVGLLVLDVTNPFFTDLARGAEEAISASGLSVMPVSYTHLSTRWRP